MLNPPGLSGEPKLASLEVQNEEGEYIIPAELYAISKETE